MGRIPHCPQRRQAVPLWLWRDRLDAVEPAWKYKFLFGERDWDFWSNQLTKTELLDAGHYQVMNPPTVEKIAISLRKALENHFANLNDCVAGESGLKKARIPAWLNLFS